MAIKMLNSRFVRSARDTETGAGGGGGTGEEDDAGTDDGAQDEGADDGTDSGADDKDNSDEDVDDKPKPKPPAGKDAWKPPTKAEWEEVQGKLTKANKEAANRRGELKQLKQQHETDTERAEREAAEAAAAKYKPTAIKASARSALLEAKAKPARVGALAGLLKMADLDIDDDGTVTGLDAEVARVKADYPEFFVSEEDEKPAPKKPGKVTPSGKPAPAKEKAPWDQIADRINGSTA